MNDQPLSTDEQDDAAFRARLAPLASEVLPPPPASGAPEPPLRRPSAVSPRPPVSGPRKPPIRRRWVLALAGIVAAVAVMGVASWRSKWRWSWPPASVPVPTRTEAVPAARPAPPATAAAPEVPAPSQAPAAAMLELLLERGNAALAEGDIMGARLLFERAAALGSASAATAAGKTYDIEFLLRVGARGIKADQAAATAWYRKAAGLGDAEAQARVARVDGEHRP